MQSLAGVMRAALFRPASAGNAARAATGDDFSEYMAAQVAQGIGLAGDDYRIEVAENGQAAGGRRQFIVTLEPVQDAAPLAAEVVTPQRQAPAGWTFGATGKLRPSNEPDPADPSRLAPIPSNRLSVNDMEDPIPEVVARLNSMGINTAGMRFELVDDVIGNWGGNYTNHILRATLPGGQMGEFSVEWTLRNPTITAVEISSLMRTPPGGAAGGSALSRVDT